MSEANDIFEIQWNNLSKTITFYTGAEFDLIQVLVSRGGFTVNTQASCTSRQAKMYWLNCLPRSLNIVMNTSLFILLQSHIVIYYYTHQLSTILPFFYKPTQHNSLKYKYNFHQYRCMSYGSLPRVHHCNTKCTNMTQSNKGICRKLLIQLHINTKHMLYHPLFLQLHFLWIILWRIMKQTQIFKTSQRVLKSQV